MTPEWRPVQSSNIAALSYDPEAYQLCVRFKNGGEYAYSNVDQALANEIENADSIGSHFNRLIKSQPQAYPFHKLN